MFRFRYGVCRLSLCLLLSIALVVAAPGIHNTQAQTTTCNSNDSTAPCFAGVSDILGGQTHLLRNDDLIVAGYRGDNAGNFFLLTWALQTTNSTITGQNDFQSGSTTGNTSLAAAAGRMFGPQVTGDDVTATVGTVGSALWLLISDFGNNNILIHQAIPTSLPFGVVDYAGMADFTGDGFTELVVHNEAGSLLIATADGSTLTWGPEFNTGANNGLAGPLPAAFAIGDFLGNGGREIAMVREDPSTVTGLVLTIYTVDAATLQISQAGSTTLPIPDASAYDLIPSLAAGRFGTVDHDQLVLLYTQNPLITSPVTTKLVTIDIDSFFNPTVKSHIDFGTAYAAGISGRVAVRSGRLNWFSQYDQAAVLLENSASEQNSLSVYGFSTDGNLTPTKIGGTNVNAQFPSCIYDLAVGNFDNMQGNTGPPPNLQMALVGPSACLSPDPLQVAIYTMDPETNAPGFTSIYTVSGSGSPGTLNPVLVSADTRGRSLVLGPVEKVTVTGHIQPDTVLGLPPMHVDWITAAGAAAPDVLNVSVFPATFNTLYNFQQTTGTQATRKSTTSYTVSTKESAQEKVSYGIPAVAGVSVDLNQSAQQTHNESVAANYNTYQGNSFKLSAQTEFDDRVAATSSQTNIYSYQVLSQCVADQGASPLGGCPANTRPLYVQFSGPDNVYYIDLAEGAAIEWYQPVQEPGNIFSYPGSLAQLQAYQPAATPLQLQSAANNVWDSQSPEQVSISWTQGGGSDVTSGSVSTHSFDTSVSVSGNAAIEGFGLSAGAGFDYNDSQSVTTLNTASNTFSESTGVIVNRGIPGGPTTSDNYLYAGQSFIFGQAAPTGTLQDIPLTTTVQAPGYLAVGFVADPLSTGDIQSGNWWTQAYTASPDVALNHPQRWLQKEPSGVNAQQVWFNCPAGYTSSPTSPACTPIQQQATPAVVADASFYQMKGLFVTPGTTANGPQITTATQGDTVTLRVRVYNYSLAGMPSGTTVRVQFYAQPWDATTGQFQSQAGNSDAFAPAVFIGEGTDAEGAPLGPIPAFCGGPSGNGDPCSDPNAPANWVYAQTTWDTGAVAAESYWKFWVVAWMEQNGALVPEIAQHGLTAIPADPVNSLADIPVETYSNNLGFYNQTFFVASATAQVEAEPTGNTGGLAIGSVESTTQTLLRGRPATIEAAHLSRGPRLGSLLTLFYDGDPDNGGTLFDQEVIPPIAASGTFVSHVSFRPRTCGEHRIFVRSIPMDGNAASATASTAVQVGEDLSAELTSFERAIKAAKLPKLTEWGLLATVEAGRKSLSNPKRLHVVLEILRHEVRLLGHKKIPAETETAWLSHLDLIDSCSN